MRCQLGTCYLTSTADLSCIAVVLVHRMPVHYLSLSLSLFLTHVILLTISLLSLRLSLSQHPDKSDLEHGALIFWNRAC